MEEQYSLQQHAGISLFDSNNIPDFERKIHVGKLYRDIQKEKERLENLT